MREAPSLVIIKKLLAQGAKVNAYDPVAMEEAKHFLGDTITYSVDPYDALIGADCLLLVTEWPEFKVPNFEVIKSRLSAPLLFDGRNIYDSHEIKLKGFEYFCIGVDTLIQN